MEWLNGTSRGFCVLSLRKKKQGAKLDTKSENGGRSEMESPGRPLRPRRIMQIREA